MLMFPFAFFYALMQIAVRSGGEGQSQMLTNEAGEVRVMRYACEARDGRYFIAIASCF